MRPLDDLILALARTPIREDSLPGLRCLAEGLTDWDKFFSRAAGWDVEPVVMSNLRRHFSGSLPEPLLNRAAAREQDSRAAALSGTLVLVDLADKFSENGIDVIAMKGPAVAIAAYGDASFRSFSDIDLLVRRRDLSVARELLLSLGYSRDYSPMSEPRLVSDQHALEFSRAGVKVELHWALLSKHLRFEMGEEGLWDSSRLVSCAGAQLRVLGPAQLFMFLCAHGAKHEWDRLRWICDIAQLAERLDESQAQGVVAIARGTNARRILELALHVAMKVFGHIGGPLARQLALNDPVAARLAEQVTARLGLTEAVARPDWTASLDFRLRPLIFWTRSRERRADQIASLARVFFVPTENDPGPGPLAWIVRPVRLGWRVMQNINRSRQASAR